MLHVLSGEWPFPGEAVRVNPRNPNDPNDLVGVSEFDRREEFVNKVGGGHVLMRLIRACLSNSSAHRPASPEIHQQVSAVAGDHPPSFANKVEMLERIKTLGEEKERVVTEKNDAITERDEAVREREMVSAELEESKGDTESVRQRYAIELERLQIENADLKADNEHLHAVVNGKERELCTQEENHKTELETTVKHHQAQMESMEKHHQTQLESREKHYQAQLESKISELSSNDDLISSKSSTIESLQVKLGQALGTSSAKDSVNVFTPGVKLTFTECAVLPECCSYGQAIVAGKYVYVGVPSLMNERVHKYNITGDTWITLPDPPVAFFSIGYLCRKLSLIGGLMPSSGDVTGDIHEFDEASQQWVRSTTIPPVPTARRSATAVSWTSPPALIVCGGSDQRGRSLTVVEVYHSGTSQWHTVSPLPLPRQLMTHTIINNVLFLVGGYSGSTGDTCTKTVMSASIPQLLESCIQPSSTSPIQWQSESITDVPYFMPTAATMGGCLLVVGGRTTWSSFKSTTVSFVHAYCPSSLSWVVIGELPQPLHGCIVATLPTGELLVMGGRNEHKRETNTVYRVTLHVDV